MNIIFDITLGDLISYILSIVGFIYVGSKINIKNVNQSKSNVVGDQIAGNKIVIIDDTKNSNEFTDEFNNFLEKTELHSISSYRELKFNDLYIPIDLSHDNSDSIDKINIEDLYLEFICNPRNLIIYGNDIS